METVTELSDIVADTSDYESWLERFGPLDAVDLRYKHEQMSQRTNPFPFFRGTYYRWARHWQTNPPELLDVPRVLAVGDLHIENFGTWRDSDGRLCWGVNDFDEADELPYTNDLVRLAASVRFARKAGVLRLKCGAACWAILDGYRDCLRAGGKPFVVEERHPHIRAMAMAADRSPQRFWQKMTKLLADPPAEPTTAAKAALVQDLPVDGLDLAFRVRPRVGMGSLGKMRYVALAEWSGGWICREAKTCTPPATAWLSGNNDAKGSRISEIVNNAVRAADPFYRPGQHWIVRRLAPRCSRIEIQTLMKGDSRRIMYAMGAEAANIHLGTSGAAKEILKDFDTRPHGWLKDAARMMCKAIERDWKQWRRANAESKQ
jgi:hypothetical protein